MNKSKKLKLKIQTVKLLAGKELVMIHGGTGGTWPCDGNSQPPDMGGTASWVGCHNCSS